MGDRQCCSQTEEYEGDQWCVSSEGGQCRNCAGCHTCKTQDPPLKCNEYGPPFRQDKGYICTSLPYGSPGSACDVPSQAGGATFDDYCLDGLKCVYDKEDNYWGCVCDCYAHPFNHEVCNKACGMTG